MRKVTKRFGLMNHQVELNLRIVQQALNLALSLIESRDVESEPQGVHPEPYRDMAQATAPTNPAPILMCVIHIFKKWQISETIFNFIVQNYHN
jgi:hypothetical protein